VKIAVDKFNWTDDMKRLGITTSSIGLILNITISNEGNEPIDMAKDYAQYNTIWIGVVVSRTDKENYATFRRTLEIDYLYLPVNGSDTRYLPVEPYDLQTSGDYAAALTWSYGSTGQTRPYTVDGQQLVGSPFNFRVLDNDTFQQQLQLNKGTGGTTINITIPIAIFGGGSSIVIVSFAVAVYLRNHKRTNEDEKVTKKRSRRRKTQVS
jgi:hypothetical protein